MLSTTEYFSAHEESSRPSKSALRSFPVSFSEVTLHVAIRRPDGLRCICMTKDELDSCHFPIHCEDDLRDRLSALMLAGTRLPCQPDDTGYIMIIWKMEFIVTAASLCRQRHRGGFFIVSCATPMIPLLSLWSLRPDFFLRGTAGLKPLADSKFGSGWLRRRHSESSLSLSLSKRV